MGVIQPSPLAADAVAVRQLHQCYFYATAADRLIMPTCYVVISEILAPAAIDSGGNWAFNCCKGTLSTALTFFGHALPWLIDMQVHHTCIHVILGLSNLWQLGFPRCWRCSYSLLFLLLLCRSAAHAAAAAHAGAVYCAPDDTNGALPFQLLLLQHDPHLILLQQLQLLCILLASDLAAIVLLLNASAVAAHLSESTAALSLSCCYHRCCLLILSLSLVPLY